MDQLRVFFGGEMESRFEDGLRATRVSAIEISSSPNPCAVMPHEIVPFGPTGGLVLIDLVFDGDCHIPYAPPEAIGSLGMLILLTGGMEVAFEDGDHPIERRIDPGECIIKRVEDPPGSAVYLGGAHFRAVGMSFGPQDIDYLLSLDWGTHGAQIRRLLMHNRPGTMVGTSERVRNLARSALDCNLEGEMRTRFLSALVPGLLCAMVEAVDDQSLTQRSLARSSLVDAAMDARDRILASLDDAPTLEGLAVDLGMRPRGLAASLQDVFGMSVADIVREARLVRARQQLSDGQKDLDEIALDAGYRHVSNFTTAFRRRFHMPPRAFQKLEADVG